MSDPAYYLWVQEKKERSTYNPMMGHDERRPGQWMAPLDAKTLDEARTKALLSLDSHDLTRNRDNEDFKIHHAIIYVFQENVIGFYEKDKNARQGDIQRRHKQEELKLAENEVTRLKKELEG